MLTAKQEQFAINIVSGMTQADAYRSAYNTDNMADDAIYTEAWRLTVNPQVANRIQELRNEAAKGAVMSAQERMEYLTGVVRETEQERRPVVVGDTVQEIAIPADIPTKIRAIDTLNKMTGEYTQRVEAAVSVSRLEDLL